MLIAIVPEIYDDNVDISFEISTSIIIITKKHVSQAHFLATWKKKDSSKFNHVLFPYKGAHDAWKMFTSFENLQFDKMKKFS